MELPNITNISKLSTVHKLKIEDCAQVTDVSALHNPMVMLKIYF